jgi:ubiquinone/menaquinone biosynthesis C-methylase UbiE
MAELEVSGERMIEGAYVRSLDAYVIYIMHTASYAFAQRFCAGSSVLDLGCGSGYGAARIAEKAAYVHGVDVDGGAVEFARDRYGRDNLEFSKIESGQPLPFHDQSYDVVLSFQVIEHVSDHDAYLAEARRVLKQGGVILVITPDRRHRLLPGQRPWNRWHVREYSESQLSQLMGRHFAIEASLKMGAEWNIAGVEIRRYRRTKWLTLPFTLPFIPGWLRRKGLDALHRLRAKPGQVGSNERVTATDFGFDESSMRIGRDPENSLNLVVVGRKSGSPEA